MKVAILTIQQKESIQGQEYAPDSYFNPIQDANENWIISLEEIEQCVNPQFTWVKELLLIDFKVNEEDYTIWKLQEAS